MRTLRIAVPAYVIKDSNYLGEIGYPRMIIAEDFPRSIQQAGAACYLLSVSDDTRYLEEQIALMDAVILAGGDDIEPHRYGQEPSHSSLYDYLRDFFECEVLRLAVKLDKPVLGICRGLQLINTYFGGTLYQDLRAEKATEFNHKQDNQIRIPFHTVHVNEESELFKAVEEGTLRVNSIHHQAIRELAPGFKVAAKSHDGLIEAIEREEDTFVAGVQWHPEMMSTHDKASKKIFSYFLEKVRLSVQ